MKNHCFLDGFCYFQQSVLFFTRCALGMHFWRSLASLGHLLASTWPLLGASWAQVGASWALCWPSRAPLGRLLALLGSILAPLGPILVPLGPHLGAPGANLAPLGRLLCRTWRLLGTSLTPLGYYNVHWSVAVLYAQRACCYVMQCIVSCIGYLKYFIHTVLTTMWCYAS